MSSTTGEHKTNIRWDEDELRLIRGELLRIWGIEYSLSKGAALSRAVEVLPEHRRNRKAYLYKYGPRIKMFVDSVHKEFMEHPPQPSEFMPAKEKAEPKAEPIQPVEQEDNHSEAEEVKPRSPFASVFQDDEIPIVRLLGELAIKLIANLDKRLDRVEAAVLDAVALRIAGPVARQAPRIPATIVQAPIQEKVWRVCVIGFMKDQFDHLQRRSASLPFKLIWIDKEARRPEVPVTDFILTERHIAHRWDDVAKPRVPSNRYAMVNGITEGVQKLYDWHSQVKSH